MTKKFSKDNDNFLHSTPQLSFEHEEYLQFPNRGWLPRYLYIKLSILSIHVLYLFFFDSYLFGFHLPSGLRCPGCDLHYCIVIFFLDILFYFNFELCSSEKYVFFYVWLVHIWLYRNSWGSWNFGIIILLEIHYLNFYLRWMIKSEFILLFLRLILPC